MTRGWNRSPGNFGQGDYSGVRLFPPLTPVIKATAILLGSIYLLEVIWFHWIAGQVLAPGSSALLHLPLVASELFRGMVWQPLTYLLLHDPTNPSHILMNLLMLWIFGAELETSWGRARFIRFLLLCGVGGALGVVLVGLLLHDSWNSQVIGASGAVYGVMAAYGTLYKNRVLWPIPIKAKHLVLIILGFTVLSFLMRSQDSFGAHLGGLATGVLLAGGRQWTRRLWPRRLRRVDDPSDRIARLFVESDRHRNKDKGAGRGNSTNLLN